MTEEEPFDLQKLIAESEAESKAAPDNYPADGEVVTKAYMHQPMLIAFSWLICTIVAIFLYLTPAYPVRSPGAQSIDSRLRIAIYHAAHRVETYRRDTGSLPEYFEPGWHEGRRVAYEVINGRYVITGRIGDLTITYTEGDDPETLLGQQPESVEVPIEQ
jgi:hypothetical protein